MVIALSLEALLWWLCFNSRLAYTVVGGNVNRVTRIDIGGRAPTDITPTKLYYDHVFDLTPSPSVAEFLEKTKQWESQEVNRIT